MLKSKISHRTRCEIWTSEMLMFSQKDVYIYIHIEVSSYDNDVCTHPKTNMSPFQKNGAWKMISSFLGGFCHFGGTCENFQGEYIVHEIQPLRVPGEKTWVSPTTDSEQIGGSTVFASSCSFGFLVAVNPKMQSKKKGILKTKKTQWKQHKFTSCIIKATQLIDKDLNQNNDTTSWDCQTRNSWSMP